jgi:hypothetical protein
MKTSEFGTNQSIAPDAGNRPHVFRSGAATAPDPLCPFASPSPRQFAKLLYLSIALPAPVHRVPLLAGIRIYNDEFACDLAQLPDEVANEFGCGAINPDPDDLGSPVE